MLHGRSGGTLKLSGWVALCAVIHLGALLAQADTVSLKSGEDYEGAIVRKTAISVLFDVIDSRGNKKRRSFPWTQIATLREGAAPAAPDKPAPASAPKPGTAAVPTPTPTPAPGRGLTGSASTVLGPFVEKYCVSCHGPEKQKGKLRLDGLAFTPTQIDNYEQWQEVLAQIDLNEMPPEDHDTRPTAEERKAISEWLTPSLKSARVEKVRSNGKTVLRRLNRAQYRNTLRDLMKIDVSGQNDPTVDFPPDETADGFSNVGSALLMSDLLMENYLRAAEAAMARSPVKPSSDPEVIRAFATKAFRRPVTTAQIAPYLLKADGKATEPLRIYQAILCSPRMVYFGETPGDLDDYAVASRLSYFLWSTMPDDTLFSLAEQGKLRDPVVIAQQIDRMLKDPKSDAFIHQFVWEWLKLQNMMDMPPEKKRFQAFYDDNLGPSMIGETMTFFRHVLMENRPVTDFLDSDYTFVDAKLAKHYGIKGVSGSEFQKVSLADHPMRGGLFGQASVLATTTDGMSTTPIYRGKWVLAALMGTKLPSPPAEVPDLPDVTGAKTIRERLDMHRNVRECAVCHVKIDPLGFPFEAFDPIGAYREKYDNGRDVETWGKMSGGSYKDVVGFKKIMLKKADEFAFNLAKQLMTYGAGRTMEASDRSDIRKIVSETEAKGYGLKDMLIRICTDPMFLSK